MPSPETILQGRYRIIRQLGRGGVGTVYEALDLRVNALVALKQANVATDAGSPREFKSEAELLANLHHAALPRVMDYFVEGTDEFLVMEHIPGYDLLQLLARRGSPFHVDSVLSWADTLLDLLEYLHQRQPPVLHRDIKPSNLKLTQEEKIFLLDFGLAKGRAGQMATLLTDRSVRGYTPVYSPLEQILARGTDQRSDLYSLGATLYHLLAGVPPTDAPTRYELLESGQPDPLLPLRQLNPKVPGGVVDVIDRAMAIARKDRPESATAMRQALAGARAESKSVAQEKVGLQGQREEERRRLATTEGGHIRATEPGQRMEIDLAMPVSAHLSPTPRRGGARMLVVVGVVLAVIGAVVAFTMLKRDRSENRNSTSVAPTASPRTETPLVVAAGSPLPSPTTIPGKSITEDLNGATMELMLIPAGTFDMGSPADDGNASERPQHKVTVQAFYMSKFEVTQKQYQALMGINLSEFRGDDLPVENVSWNFAEDFCARLSQVTGREHRLPTEAEWEYACRAGTTTKYAFGNSLSSTQANYDGTYPLSDAAIGPFRQRTTPVGTFGPNGFGLYDMHGNVWEWCLDTYHENYVGAPSHGAAWLGESPLRIVRGGSWLSRPEGVRSAVRERAEAESGFSGIGFRVVTVAR